MSRNIDFLVHLAKCQAAHENVTHWAISMRIFGKGDFFDNFIKRRRKQCNVDAWFRVMYWFDRNWPEDLEWPADIPRLSEQKGDAA